MVVAPPMAEVAVARLAATKKPATRRRSPNMNGRPNQRSISQATRTASPALQKPLNVEVRRLRSLRRLAAMVPTTRPITTAGHACRRVMIRMPAAMPDAGQNTATSEGTARSASPSRAARKYAIAMPLAVPTVIVNGPAIPARRCRSLLIVWNPRTTPQLARNLGPKERVRLSAANFTLDHQVLSAIARELTLSTAHTGGEWR